MSDFRKAEYSEEDIQKAQPPQKTKSPLTNRLLEISSKHGIPDKPLLENIEGFKDHPVLNKANALENDSNYKKLLEKSKTDKQAAEDLLFIEKAKRNMTPSESNDFTGRYAQRVAEYRATQPQKKKSSPKKKGLLETLRAMASDLF